jgi:hypothetical protein
MQRTVEFYAQRLEHLIERAASLSADHPEKAQAELAVKYARKSPA